MRGGLGGGGESCVGSLLDLRLFALLNGRAWLILRCVLRAGPGRGQSPCGSLLQPLVTQTGCVK